MPARLINFNLRGMSPEDAFPFFDSLTEKQHATLLLASRHMTSKQIAIELGVAPVTIDKRIEAIRSRLDAIPRPDLLRLYGQWHGEYDHTIDHRTILAHTTADEGCSAQQPQEFAFTFEDSLHFDARAPWERNLEWLRPGLSPSDLGMMGKLFVMLGGAVAIMMVAVLLVAFADALMSIIAR